MKATIQNVPGTDLFQVVKNGITLTRPLDKHEALCALALFHEDHIDETSQCHDMGQLE